MLTSTACGALEAGKCLEIGYDGYSRVVEVHAVGTTTKGHPAIRVWQVRGGSVSGEKAGWKLLKLDEAGAIRMLDEKSSAPRPGYKRGDKDMSHIICQV
jgi:hypothetical protein